MLEMAAKCSNYAKNSGLCFLFWIILFEADYAKNYAGILYQCLPINQKVLFPVRRGQHWLLFLLAYHDFHTASFMLCENLRLQKRTNFSVILTAIKFNISDIKAGPPLDLSFWSFLTFLHHNIAEVERHLL